MEVGAPEGVWCCPPPDQTVGPGEQRRPAKHGHGTDAEPYSAATAVIALDAAIVLAALGGATVCGAAFFSLLVGFAGRP
jgi:hypothetical protein